MNRRAGYLIAIALFIPLILWYAGTFSDLPEVTFSEAKAVSDTVENSRVLVAGVVVPDKEIKKEGGLTFYLKDEAGTQERVVYEGSDDIPPTELQDAMKKGAVVKVAGHMCSDGQGPRFHAKNVYLSN